LTVSIRVRPWEVPATQERLFKLAQQSDGSLWAWGRNSSGELGEPPAKAPGRPGQVVRVGTASDWVAIGAAGSMSAGLTANGGLWVWGIRLDQPPTVRVRWLARFARFLGPLLRQAGVNPDPDQEIVYAQAPAPQRILTFQTPSSVRTHLDASAPVR
jgi:hypothetical protein